MNELLQALAREISQTSQWLTKEKVPDSTSVKYRLHTLREAASTVEMKSVELALGRLESSLDSIGSDGLYEILDQLSKLLFDLAQPNYKNKRLWLVELNEVDTELETLTTSMNHCVGRLMNIASVSDNVLLRAGEDISSDGLMKLSKGLRSEISEIQKSIINASLTTEKLRSVSHRLMQDFSSNGWIPLDTAFAGLRQKVRRWSKSNTKPVALRLKADMAKVGIEQYKDLLSLVNILLDEIMTNGLDEPEDRNKAGKPTVAGIFIEAKPQRELLQLAISHDGIDSHRPIVLPSTASKNLRELRAGLFKDEHTDVGQKLLLQFPLWHSITEATKIQCEIGVAYVPLTVIQRLDKTPAETLEKLPIVRLDRRVGPDKKEHFSNGLVFSLGHWQGYLPCNILGATKRIIIDSAGGKDPLWILGWTGSDDEKYPVIHPLALRPAPPHWRSIYPMETKA